MKSAMLILGGTGSIGYAFTENLLQKNIPVTLLVRDLSKAQKLFPASPYLELVEGDVLDIPLLKQLAKDKKYIFHGVNYPYPLWFPQMENVTNAIIEAASLNHATIIFTGNVYNYGKTPLITETSPEAPCTRKGMLRSTLEQHLRAVANAGKCTVLNVRLPDFWGPNVLNKGVEPIFTNALQKKALPYLMRTDIPHQMVYTRDAAEVIARLTLLPQQTPYTCFNYGGQIHPTIQGLLHQIARTANAPAKVTVLPAWLFTILGLFNKEMKEVKEMLYLFEQTILLDDTKVRQLLPDFTETPLQQAIEETLAWFQRYHTNH